MAGSVGAILLAAGASRRMGSCKQLLDLGGKTILARSLETLLAGGIREVVVVVSPAGDRVADQAARYPVRVVRNSDPEGDMAASIRTGRDALSSDVSGILIAQCDYPLITPETIGRLAREHALTPERIVIPCHDGRRGHPPLVPRRLLDLLEHPFILRDLLRAHQDLVRHLELPDQGILIDMDTPEDYRRIAALCGTAS